MRDIDNVELHMDINVQVVIPEWLRAKMGLTKEVKDDAENESCCCDNDDEDDARQRISPETTEERAHRKAIEELLKVLGDTDSSGVSCTIHRHVHRRQPRM